MKTAILTSEMSEGRDCVPCGGFSPTSDGRRSDTGSRSSIVVSVSKVRKVCHGGRVVVEIPRLVQARYTKDFGPGFYCTVLREQAVRWAVRFTGRGWLSHFDYRPDPSLDTLVFPQMSEEWLDFVVACRHGDPHAHDIVEGPMANDTIYNYVQDFINLCALPIGEFGNVGTCRYAVPSYWDIGAVYARLIEDVSDGADPITKLLEVYASWMSDALSRFNSDLFYQSRGYIAECYRAGEILAA